MCCPFFLLLVSCNTSRNILYHQWSFPDHCDEQSWDLISFLVMESCYQSLCRCFPVLIYWFCFHLCLQRIFLPCPWILLFLFYMCIKKIIVLMSILCSVDMIIWVFKACWLRFWSMTINCSLIRICVVCISFFAEVFRSCFFNDFYEGSFLWMPFYLWKIVLWR